MQAVTKQKMVAITWLARSRRIGKAGRNGVAPLLPVVRMGNRRRRVIASGPAGRRDFVAVGVRGQLDQILAIQSRSEEHTSELQSLMRISSAVFCLKKKNKL